MLVIPREVEHGGTDHHIGEPIGERHPLDGANLKILRRQPRLQRCGQTAHVVDSFGILIQREYLAPFAQQVDQVAPVAASGIEHAHAGRNVPAQNLIEDIDIDLAELLLNVQGHNDTFSIDRDRKAKRTLHANGSPTEPLSDFTVSAFHVQIKPIVLILDRRERPQRDAARCGLHLPVG